ncbi:hypothetical protein [Enterococcus phage PEF1]
MLVPPLRILRCWCSGYHFRLQPGRRGFESFTACILGQR